MAESEARVWRAWSTTCKEFKAKVKRRHWKALTRGVHVLHCRKITQATEWTTIWSGTKVTPWAPVAATQPRRGGDFTFQGSGPYHYPWPRTHSRIIQGRGGFFIRGIFEDFKIGVRSGFYRDNFSWGNEEVGIIHNHLIMEPTCWVLILPRLLKGEMCFPCIYLT